MTQRQDRLKQFNTIANCLKRNEEEIINILCEIETYKTAKKELDKTIKALTTYQNEDKYLENREPLGTVAIFLPFNMPLYSLILYAFGPMYIGNKVLVKPSKLTYSQIEKIWSICVNSVGNIPLELSNESGKVFLRKITKNRPVNAIVFTGQWESVNNIVEELPNGIKLIYSGSGVCPLIVRDDADVNVATDVAIESRLFNSGQDCLCTERILIHESLADEFIEMLINKLRNIHMSCNTDKNSELGMLISSDLIERARELVQNSKGTILLDGINNVNYIDPTVLLTTPDQKVFQVEKFAPVFPIAIFPDNKSMVTQVNLSDHILGVTVIGGFFPDDAFIANHVEYNRSVLEFEEDDSHVPFGGYRKSGFIYINQNKREGPILFSVETSKTINN